MVPAKAVIHASVRKEGNRQQSDSTVSVDNDMTHTVVHGAEGPSCTQSSATGRDELTGVILTKEEGERDMEIKPSLSIEGIFEQRREQLSAL